MLKREPRARIAKFASFSRVLAAAFSCLCYCVLCAFSFSFCVPAVCFKCEKFTCCDKILSPVLFVMNSDGPTNYAINGRGVHNKPIELRFSCIA